jgi:hypothetical protein
MLTSEKLISTPDREKIYFFKNNPKCPFLMRVKIFHIYSVVFLLPLFFIEEFFCKTYFTPKCVTIVLSLIIIIKLDDTTPTPVGTPKF